MIATLQDFSLAKLVYSGILLFVAMLAVSEIFRVWANPKLHLQIFDYYEDGKPKTTSGSGFAARVLQNHRLLVYLFQREYERRNQIETRTPDGQLDVHYFPTGVPPIENPKSALAEVELSVQGINVAQILTALRRWVSTPNEITGSVEVAGTDRDVVVNWPQGPSEANGDLITAQIFHLSGYRDDSTAAFDAACSLIWAQAAGNQETLAAANSKEFCTWAGAWRQFQTLWERSQRSSGLDEADVARLKRLREPLDHIVEKGTSYAEIYRLRAELIDLLPESEKGDEDEETRQQDLARYDTLTRRDLKHQVPEPPDLESIVRAASRPVYRLCNDAIETSTDESWQARLTGAKTAISQAARSTGKIRGTLGPSIITSYVGTGFVVAPNVIMTAGYVVSADLPVGEIPLSWGATIDFAAEHSGCGPKKEYRLKKLLYRGNRERLNVAVLEIESLDTDQHPPLSLVKEEPDSVAERDIFLLGFPAFDPRKSPEILQQVFEGTFNIKRLMAGQLTKISQTGLTTRLNHDATTTGGVGGAPVIDLATGTVLGVHTASDPQGAYAVPSWLVAADQEISTALAGVADAEE